MPNDVKFPLTRLTVTRGRYRIFLQDTKFAFTFLNVTHRYWIHFMVFQCIRIEDISILGRFKGLPLSLMLTHYLCTECILLWCVYKNFMFLLLTLITPFAFQSIITLQTRPRLYITLFVPAVDWTFFIAIFSVDTNSATCKIKIPT